MVMIFEDKDTVPISKMLKRIYGDSIMFLDGNRNLLKLSRDIKDSYIFVDTVYDNGESIKIYSLLRVKYKYNNSVYIIPIPCIEFYALLALYHFQLIRKEEIDNVLFISGKCDEFSRYNCDSFEIYCKNLLNAHISKCFHNTSSSKVKISWYLCSCKCSLISTGFNCNYVVRDLELDEKAAILISLLPMFICNKVTRDIFNKYNILWSDFDYESYIDLYKVMLNRMKCINIL